MRALALNCTLKASPAPSSCELLLTQVLDELRGLGVEGQMRRVADHHVPPGVESDLGDGDEWPELRRAVLDADILVLGTPIWMGQPSSVCKRVLERMDAFLAETDDAGRMVSYGRVAIVAVVGNEDGAHHTSAELYQAPASGVTYWVGEAMGRVDYRDLPQTPETTAGTTRTAAVNAAHLARLLAGSGYPAAG